MPLLFVWVLRWPFIIKGLVPVMRSPIMLAFLALLAWSCLAVLWSPSRDDAMLELRYWRWGWLLLALWPILHKRLWLIASLCVGFLVAQGAQLAEAIALLVTGAATSPLFSHPPTADPLSRISGWWFHPVHGGIMLSAALGLHLGPAFFGSGKTRVLAVIGSSLSFIGVLATGTRGALLACCFMIALLAVLKVRSRLRSAKPASLPRGTGLPPVPSAQRSSTTLRVALLAFALLLCSAAGLWLAPRFASRISEGASQLREAWQGNVDSDMGARIVALRSAADAFASSPIQGIGLHAFGSHTQRFVQQQNINLPQHRIDVLRTAHNTPAHMAASLGSVGLALWLFLACSVLWGGYQAARRTTLAATLATYHAAPLLAACCMLAAGMFDTLALNSPTACLATLLAALCMRGARD